MDITIKFENGDLVEIKNREIVSTATLDISSINQIICVLKSKVDVMYQFKSGVKMGKKTITDYVTKDGFYTRHRWFDSEE